MSFSFQDSHGTESWKACVQKSKLCFPGGAAPALLLYRRDLPRRELVPLALCSATGLPLIVVITTIGVEEGSMRPVNAAALVAAGVLSVLLYPTLARKRLGISRPALPP